MINTCEKNISIGIIPSLRQRFHLYRVNNLTILWTVQELSSGSSGDFHRKVVSFASLWKMWRGFHFIRKPWLVLSSWHLPELCICLTAHQTVKWRESSLWKDCYCDNAKEACFQLQRTLTVSVTSSDDMRRWQTDNNDSRAGRWLPCEPFHFLNHI